MLVSISSVYNDPQKVISSVENKLVSINGVQTILWNYGGLLGCVDVNIHYVLKFHIKDAKIKVDAPYFTLLTFSTGGSQSNIRGWVEAQKFFNADGTLNPKKGREQFALSINQKFNAILNMLLVLEDKSEDW